jgi:adenosylcobyric acid synthase
VLPFDDRLWLDAEDSLSTAADGVVGRPAPPLGRRWLRVAVVRLPRISNATDVDALACEPGVAVRYVTEPSRLVDSDLVVLPGTKSTVSDLEWLRRTGLADAVAAHARGGGAVLGICGGYQMLGRRIVDEVEVEGGGDVAGLGLLDLEIRFEHDKHLGRPSGAAFGHPVTGYEIHHGRVVGNAHPPLVQDDVNGPEGSDAGRVVGTHWHGLLENDGFRRALLARVGPDGFEVAPDTCFADVRAAQLDLLAGLVDGYLDTDAVLRLIADGATPGLPFVPPGSD